MCRQKRRVADDDQEDLLAGDRHAHEGGFVDEPSELSTYCVENDELPLLVDVARYEVYAVLQELRPLRGLNLRGGRRRRTGTTHGS